MAFCRFGLDFSFYFRLFVMILRTSLGLFPIFFSSKILACPNCAGSLDDPTTLSTAYILMGFIILTYIPLFLIYRVIYKHRKKPIV